MMCGHHLDESFGGLISDKIDYIAKHTGTVVMLGGDKNWEEAKEWRSQDPSVHTDGCKGLRAKRAVTRMEDGCIKYQNLVWPCGCIPFDNF